MYEIELNLIFDILKNISIIIASSVAIYSINSWRRETKWKKKYDLAEEALSLFYEIEDIISIVRSPASFGNEGKTRKQAEDESVGDSEILNRAYIVIERFDSHKEAFYKLRVLKYKFVAVFGKESEKHFKDVERLKHEIIMASIRLGRRYWKEQGRRKFTEKEFERHLEGMHKHESIIWSGGRDEDKIRERMEQVIKGIENTCGQTMRK